MVVGFGLAAVPVFLGILNHDVAWLLYAAGRVLAGDRLYVDVVETNPPLIVWLNFAPLLLANLTGITEILALRILVLLVVASSLLLAAWALRRTLPDRPGGRLLILFVALFVLLPAAGYEFGQREHLLFAMVLPYLLIAAGRAAGVPMTGRIPWLVGMFAGIGIALKPHFVLLPAAVEGSFAWVSRPQRTWRRPEALAIVSVGLAYAMALLAIAPDYLKLVGWARPVYAACNPTSLVSLIGHPAVFVSLLAWTGLWLVRPEGPYRECGRAILIANVSFVSIMLVQGKGFPYHYYPTGASAILLLALLFVASRDLCSERSRIAGVLCGGLAVALIVQISADRVVESRRWEGHPERSATSFGEMARLAKDHARRGSIFVFSPAVADSFPLVTYSGAGWASRHPCLWFLPGLYSGVDVATAASAYRTREAMGATERFLFDSVVDDLLRNRPRLLFVAESGPAAPAWRRFDYQRYFGDDPRFRAFLREYEPFTEEGGFRVYRRRLDGPLTVGHSLPRPG